MNNKQTAQPEFSLEGMIHEHTLTHILYALQESGVFEKIRSVGEEGISCEKLAQSCEVDPRVLNGILDYLALTSDFLEKTDRRYSLSQQGQIAFDEKVFYSLKLFIGAYGCLMSNLLPALRRKKIYGKDFVRDGEALATASFGVTKENYPAIVRKLNELKVKTVADLGCGAAELLIEFCKLDPSIRGIGIDIDHGALIEAKRRVEKNGMSDRIQLIQGDITNPSTFINNHVLKSVEAFTCIGVMHEFLRDGEDFVEDIFSKFQNAFPGAYFFLGEFRSRPDEEYMTLPLEKKLRDVWYQHIIHPLSWQGLPMSHAGWGRIFEKLNIKQLSIEPFFVDQYTLRL